MHRRVLYMLVLLMVLGVLPAAAQSKTLGLSDADFTVLSKANSTAIHSFAFTFDTQLAVEGLQTFFAKADVSGSGMVDMTSPAFEIGLKGTIALATTQDYRLDTEVHWVDDTFYLNPGNGWQVIKPASAYLTRAIGQYVGLNADDSAMQTWDVTGIEGLGDVLTAVTKLDLPAFVSAKRLDDEAVDDVKTAHFQLAGDLQAMMQMDSFVDVVAAFAQTQGNDLVILDHAKLAAAVKANSAMFKGATLTIDQYIGLDDALIHRIGLKLDMPIDPTADGYDDVAFQVGWALNVNLSGMNKAQVITAPDHATDVDAFAFPDQSPLKAPAEGITQYVFFCQFQRKWLLASI